MGKAEDETGCSATSTASSPPAERAEVEAALTEDDRLKLAALGELRGLVGNTLQAEAADIDLWPALEKQLGLGAKPDGKAAAARPRRRWGLRAHPASWSAGVDGDGRGGVALRRAAVAFCACAERMRHRESRDRGRGRDGDSTWTMRRIAATNDHGHLDDGGRLMRRGRGALAAGDARRRRCCSRAAPRAPTTRRRARSRSSTPLPGGGQRRRRSTRRSTC